MMKSQATLFARQPLFVAGKLAFGASVVGAFLSVVGIITLVLLTNGPGLNSILSMLCWLTSAGILFGRFRWSPVVSAIMAACILILQVLQPYVLAILTHSNGANGGLGTFIGVIIAIVCALLVFGGSIVDAIQNYRQR